MLRSNVSGTESHSVRTIGGVLFVTQILTQMKGILSDFENGKKITLAHPLNRISYLVDPLKGPILASQEGVKVPLVVLNHFFFLSKE